MDRMPLFKDALELIVAFAVAWIFYQLLSLITGSSQPVVSVVSSSMEHNANFNEWWARSEESYKRLGVSKEEFRSFPMPNGLYIGDILLIVASNDYKVGDIIVYHPKGAFCFPSLKEGQTIIHRIISMDEKIITKGDSTRNPPDRCDVLPSRIVGKALFAAPLLGYPRIALHVMGI
jgi:signal peptidase I